MNTNSIITDTNISQAIVGILSGVKNASGEVYNASKTAIASGIDLVKHQAPDLIHEFLKWKFAEAAAWTILGLVGIIAIVIIWYKSCKTLSWEIEPLIVLSGFGIVFSVPCIAAIITNGFVMLQIWIAPKIYLIEYVVRHIK